MLSKKIETSLNHMNAKGKNEQEFQEERTRLEKKHKQDLLVLENEYAQKTKDIDVRFSHNKSTNDGSSLIEKRLHNIAYIIQNVLNKKLPGADDQKELLASHNLNWVSYIQKYELSSIVIYEERSSFKAKTASDTVSCYIPTHLLTASTWGIAKYARSIVYEYKNQKALAQAKKTQKEITLAKKRILENQRELEDLQKKLQKQQPQEAEIS